MTDWNLFTFHDRMKEAPEKQRYSSGAFILGPLEGKTIPCWPAHLCRKLSHHAVGEVGISSIVSAELWYGVACSEKKRQNEAALKDFLDYLEVMAWPNEAGPVYGRMRAELKKRGRPVGAMDLLIAAHAEHLGVVLVTENTKDFEQVPDLKLENWASLRKV